MSEIYDNWDRLVGRVIRHVKDRELCYQSSISSQTSDSNSSSPRHHDLHNLTVASVSSPETASSPPVGMSKFVYRVDLDGVETMKGAFKAGDLFRLIGICFSPNVRVDLLRKPQVILKLIASITGLESVALDPKDKKLTVIGNIDPIYVMSKLRKICNTEIVSAGPAKEPMKKKDEPKKDDKKKDGPGPKDETAAQLMKAFQAYYQHPYYYQNHHLPLPPSRRRLTRSITI